MCFGRWLKGDADPPNNSSKHNSNNHDNASPSVSNKSSGKFPSAMPQEHDNPPPGPPPSSNSYAPPPGPPPSHAEYAPPPGPPPNHRPEPPVNNDWTVVPDTALLPPPPSIGHDNSPTGNAPEQEAQKATDWCRHHPLWQPKTLTSHELHSLETGDIHLQKPREYVGDLVPSGLGHWKGRTWTGTRDSCLLTTIPLYAALHHSPVRTGKTKTIYFELLIHGLGRGDGADECTVAVGFCAQPYPAFRMPGWQRGSLAVHSDDGRRFVNDMWGGKDFTAPFKVGDVVGIGMTFAVPENPPEYGAAPQATPSVKANVIFTRNGKHEGGWDVHEELDASGDLDAKGLDGQVDLYAAVGVFGGVDFQVFFNSKDWKFQDSTQSKHHLLHHLF